LTVDSEDVLAFWLADAAAGPEKAAQRASFWFQSDPAVDETIARRFSKTVASAAARRLDSWERSPRPCLALVILLDQFPRNLYRSTPAAFGYDAQALDVAARGMAAGHFDRLAPVEQWCFLMPYEHSEDLSIQREGMKLFEQLVDRGSPEWQPLLRQGLDYARRHLDIVERFGRFPHRNAILGRASTAAERAYLEAGGETFGQST
jgi:uncharacterized protein (DUF924 family)